VEVPFASLIANRLGFRHRFSQHDQGRYVMTQGNLLNRRLHDLRHALAAAIAACVAALPWLERPLIGIGRTAATRSQMLGGLYWFVQESLVPRLRHNRTCMRVVEVLGHRLQLDVSDRTGRMPYFYRTPYEEAVTEAIVRTLRPGDVFVDVGANIGYFTALAARVVGPTGRVLAFEPHNGAREALEAMVQRNGVSATVEIVPLALAEAGGDARLFVQDAVTSHSTLEPTLSPMRHVAAFHPDSIVHVTTLDDWLASHPELVSRIRCVKIDVEGAEARVIGGMTKALQLARLTIVCETTIGSAADAALTHAGFDRHRIEPGTESYGNFLYLRP
jgi:FkbM family methyltransferase